MIQFDDSNSPNVSLIFMHLWKGNQIRDLAVREMLYFSKDRQEFLQTVLYIGEATNDQLEIVLDPRGDWLAFL